MNKEKEVEAYLRGELPEEERIKYEIAEELGVCQQSVNRIMNQAVKRLRKNF